MITPQSACLGGVWFFFCLKRVSMYYLDIFLIVHTKILDDFYMENTLYTFIPLSYVTSCSRHYTRKRLRTRGTVKTTTYFILIRTETSLRGRVSGRTTQWFKGVCVERDGLNGQGGPLPFILSRQLPGRSFMTIPGKGTFTKKKKESSIIIYRNIKFVRIFVPLCHK